MGLVAPLRPVPTVDEYLRAVFDKRGYLAAEFDGYKLRPGQVALTRAVDRVIRGENGKTHLIAEGPTGTGKSLAYLVPATFHAAVDGKTVVVVTANIALQEQLMKKDLPLLEKILPWPVKFALMKGIGNFLCLSELDDVKSRSSLHLQFDSKGRGARTDQIIEWAEHTETGDKSELSFEPGALWSDFSTTSDDCKREKCPERKNCFAMRALRKAREAKVIVANYHLLFADMLVYRKTEGIIRIIPPYQIAILDEAHKAADIARDFFGFRFTAQGMSKTIRRCMRTPKKEGVDPGVVETVEFEASKFFRDLGEYFRSKQYKTRLKVQKPIEWQPLVAAVLTAAERMHEAIGLLDRGLSMPALTEEEVERIEGRIKDQELGIRRCKEYAVGITAAMELSGEPNHVYFIEEDRRGNAALVCKTVDVASIIHDDLFEKASSVTLTSATLATGGSFDYIASEVGAPAESTETLVAKSPFSHKQSLLVVPTNEELPLPTDRDAFTEAVPEVVEKIVRLADGRTLALFTSYKNLRATEGWLRAAMLPFTLLVQGSRPRLQLLEAFKRDESSVLLGTESFWAGVDVPGAALSCVIIDRLPFPTPDDPVLDAIAAHDDRWFFNYSVPRAQIMLKQGAGRLIRSVTDRGVVVVLDRRIIEKSYGDSFLSTLPRMMRSRKLESVRRFLGEGS